MTAFTPTVTHRLATWAEGVTLDTVPKAAIDIAKDAILDTVGVTLAGARDHAGQISIDLAKSWGGQPVSALIGGGERTSAPNAALANGTSAHALDFDDRSVPINHFNASLVPAVLALGDAINASGRAVLEAFIAGYEVGARVGTGFGTDYYFSGGWHPANSWANIGTAVGCAKLLNQNSDQIRTSTGIASSAAGGLRKHYGSQTKPLHCGYAARNGVVAAELAARGFTSDEDILDQAPEARPTAHKYFSFPQVFCGPGGFDLAAMVEGLGEAFFLVEQPPEVKFHPGSISTNKFIDATLVLMEEQGFAGGDVAHVNCVVAKSYLDAASPFLNPTNPDEARYSLPYQIAVTLLDGRCWIDQHSEKRMAQPDVADLLAHVSCEEIKEDDDEAYGRSVFQKMEAAKLEFSLKDGRVLATEPAAKALKPANTTDLLAKYRDCATRAISPEACEHSIDLVSELETLSAIREYTETLL